MPTPAAKPAASEAVLTKAVLNAADKLDVNGVALAPILGVSEATVSRMKSGDYRLDDQPEGIRARRSVRPPLPLAGRNRRRRRSGRAGLARQPEPRARRRAAEQIRTVTGLVDVIAYLDARRAPI